MLARSASLTWESTKAGMMPQGLRTAWANSAPDRPRPARSGPKPPSPLAPWQFLHWVTLPSHRALPAARSRPASWAMAAVVQRASAPREIAIFFMIVLIKRRKCPRLLDDDQAAGDI